MLIHAPQFFPAIRRGSMRSPRFSRMSARKVEPANIKSITGTYKGRRILAISTGMGGPSTAICVEELADLGVTDLIRIGSCGALQRDLRLGQLVICDRAVCDDGTTDLSFDTFTTRPELVYLRKPDHDGTSFTDTDAVSADADIAARQRPNAICYAPADSSLTIAWLRDGPAPAS